MQQLVPGPRFPADRLQAALLVYGLLNALLYASLLPLWEGFDEPFHYAYVQQLGREWRLPGGDGWMLTEEVWASMHLTPASPAVRRNVPSLITFNEYFRLPASERAAMRLRLESIPPHTAYRFGTHNYEADQQPPLPYAVLALADRAMAGQRLTLRVWLLRLIAGMASVALMWTALRGIADRLELGPLNTAALLFIVLSFQMFYAATVHIANDWLAVPLMVLLMDRLLALAGEASTRNLCWAAAVLAAGLLSKAYFLALVPLALGLIVFLWLRSRLRLPQVAAFCAIVLALAGPWYARNLFLRGTISGMQETARGADLFGLLSTALGISWPRSIERLTFASVWMGNNSFTSFSWLTIAIFLAGVVMATVLLALHPPRSPDLRRKTVVGVLGLLLYAAALLYSTVVIVWSTGGAGLAASPWYVQPVIPVHLALGFVGIARAGRVGRITAALLVCVSAYIFSATFWVKLIPMYGGFGEGRATLAALVRWYGEHGAALPHTLASTALEGGPVLLVTAALSTLFCLAMALVLMIRKINWMFDPPKI